MIRVWLGSSYTCHTPNASKQANKRKYLLPDFSNSIFYYWRDDTYTWILSVDLIIEDETERKNESRSYWLGWQFKEELTSHHLLILIPHDSEIGTRVAFQIKEVVEIRKQLKSNPIDCSQGEILTNLLFLAIKNPSKAHWTQQRFATSHTNECVLLVALDAHSS